MFFMATETNKNNHTEYVGIRIPSVTMKALRSFAKTKDLTVSQIIRRAIREYLSRTAI